MAPCTVTLNLSNGAQVKVAPAARCGVPKAGLIFIPQDKTAAGN